MARRRKSYGIAALIGTQGIGGKPLGAVGWKRIHGARC
jgi:hypothetical protein